MTDRIVATVADKAGEQRHLPGRLGLRDEARAALEALRRLDPAAGSDGYVRAAFASWIWTDEEMERVVEGVRQARALQ